MITAIWTITLNGFREASRNRVTVVVFAFALVMILSATVALEFTITTFERVMTDLGLGVMSLISVALTIFLGSGLIPREIERRSIYLVVSRPVSRATFIIGRLLGNVLTVFVMTVVMAILLRVQFVAAHIEPSATIWIAVAGLLLEIVLLSAVSVFLSTWSSQMVTVVVSIGIYFVGHASTELYKLASHAKLASVNVVGKALYYVLPNLDRLDFKPQATYAEAVAPGELFSAVVYALGYTIGLTAIACFIFERRDFK